MKSYLIFLIIVNDIGFFITVTHKIVHKYLDDTSSTSAFA